MNFNPVTSNIKGSGRVQAIDYVSSGGNNAGDVVVVNGLLYFCITDIAAGARGSVALEGGVWAGAKDTTVWTIGQRIYWNPTGNPNVGTAGTGAFTNAYAAGYIFAGICVLSKDTGLPAATGDQYGYFAKLNGSNSNLKTVANQVTTVTGSDTIVTGLTVVVAAIANLDSAPVLTCDRATASIGNQAGAPAAGSILIQTWMPTSNSNPTPIEATTFSKNVNYVAVGY
ncbi:MAG: DUF2190 family protein [Tepidisphaeraceae bacterium]|jgi:predicted RecA/RadA family phage recombinase